MKKVLHLLSAGTIGGIEVLCRDLATENKEENVFAFLFHGGPIEEQIEAVGASVYRVYHTNRWNVPKFTARLVEICQQEQITHVVVHHEGISTWFYYLLLMQKLRKLVYIRYIHSAFEESYYYTGNPIRNMCKKKLLQKVFTKSDKLIAVSEFVKKSVESKFTIREQQIAVVYNGISQNRIEHNMLQPKTPHKGIRLIYIGRLVEMKGVDLLLDALYQISKTEKDISLLILGDGDARKRLEHQAETLEIQSQVRFEGFQLDIEKYLLDADIFVYPSRCQEAFGISIIEAMSYRMLCVASEVGGIPEIIEDGRNGYLYRENKAEQLTKAIKRAIADGRTKNAEDVRKAAMETAMQFTLEKTVAQLNRIYKSL